MWQCQRSVVSRRHRHCRRRLVLADTNRAAMQLRRAQRRLLWRRHRTAEPARRSEDQSRGCTSTPWSRCSTAAAARASCATSWACCRRATCSSARWRWRATKARRAACCCRALPTLERTPRLAGHTGGNLLLSMMEQYSGDFLAAVDGLRALLGCKRPRLAGQRRARVAVRRVRRRLRRRAARSKSMRADQRASSSSASGSSRRSRFTRPSPRPSASFDAVIIGPGSFFTSLMPTLLVAGVKEALARCTGRSF